MNMNQSLAGSELRFRYRGACFWLFKFHLLNGPVQSQNIIHMHLKNMLFGSVNAMQNAQFTSHSRLYMGEGSLPKEATDLTTWKSDPLMSAEPTQEPTQEQLCGGGYSPHGDECCECYESEDSDSECGCDSEGCCEYDDSDNDDGDDLVEFSDETRAAEVECESANLPKCETFMSLSSIESGYFETRSDSVSSDEMSEDECDHKRADIDDNEVVWKCFEELALSPVLSRGSQRNSSHSKLNPTELTVKTSNDAKEKCYTRDNVMCRPSNSCIACVQSCSEQCASEMCLLESSTSSTITCINPLYKDGEKRVSFKPDSELVVVHYMIAWDFAYRAARKGPWEEYARDRQHFRRRIDSLSSIITPCLIRKLKVCSSTS